MTHTNIETHKIISGGYHRTPKIGSNENSYGTGPRYCPSIEKKLWMFPDKN